MVRSWRKKISLKLENRIRHKCRIWFSVTPGSRKTILDPSKNQFLKTKLFGHKLRWKKFPWNRKIQLATNAEYDRAWSADHEKLYLSTSKNQFLRWKYFGQKLRSKKFLWNWKIEMAKNAEYDSAWCANHEKLYLSL